MARLKKYKLYRFFAFVQLRFLGLTACAENGGRAPEDLAPYLPWFNPRLLPTKASQPIHSRAPPPPSGAEVDTTGLTLH
jgi:hypothetical protein